MTAPGPVVLMEVHNKPLDERRFMTRYERYEPVILDHTAIITAKNCLRKYFYRIVLGRAPREEAIYFAWGSAYHKFREELEKAYGFGDAAPKKYDPEIAKEAYLVGMMAGIEYWKKHGKDQDTESKFSWMTQERLIRSFVEAFKHWEREKLKGAVIVLAVEQPFNIEMPDGSFRSGKADQIVRWGGKPWGRDFKTSSKDGAFYQRTLDPNEQFTGYTWAESKLTGTQVQGQLVEVLFNAKSTKNKQNGPEIIELTASRTAWQLSMWEREHMFFKKIIDSCREEDTWPMEEVGCSFCEYHSVCKQGNEAGMMYQLETQFKVSPWDNTRIGMDL